jgi:hypothetical protein
MAFIPMRTFLLSQREAICKENKAYVLHFRDTTHPKGVFALCSEQIKYTILPWDRT